MPQPNGRLQLLLTGDTQSMQKRLQITDPVSGVTFAEVRLDPVQFLELMSHAIPGSVEGVPAWIAPDLHRIGKHHAHVSVSLRTVTNPVGDAAEQALENWARMAQRRIEAYSYSIGRHNNLRTSVTFRAYYGTEEGAQRWKVASQAVLDELRATAPGGQA